MLEGILHFIDTYDEIDMQGLVCPYLVSTYPIHSSYRRTITGYNTE